MILIRKTHNCIAFLILLLALLTGETQAQWSVNPSVNTSIAVGTGAQECKSIPDGSGGAIFTWIDFRNSRRDIYAQRVDRDGIELWTSNGVAICTVIADNRFIKSIITDNAGGAIITWEDDRSGFVNIYTQRINGGTLQWPPADGKAITALSTGVSCRTTVADDAGGAFIFWIDSRNAATDIYAQHIDVAGAIQWATDGLAISLTTVSPGKLLAATDGSGGAFITWYQTVSGNYKVYAQRINASGAAWAGDVQVSTMPSTQLDPEIASDGSGGAIITWLNSYADVYAQRINGAGSPQWTSDGVAVTANGSSPILVSDDAGGAIISWLDASTSIYAKRLDSGGNEVWTGSPLGVPVYTDVDPTYTDLQTFPLIVSDKSGGAIITWIDSRLGFLPEDMDLYAQRINASGGLNWASNGVLIATEVFSNPYETAIVSDGSGGAIFSWQDFRSSVDIYTQNICANGALGIAAPPPPTNVTSAANLTICSGKSTSLSVSGIGTIGWYNASKGGTYLGTGTNYATPALTTTTTYYVQDSICAANGIRTPIRVTVNSLPTIIISPSIHLCIGQSTLLTPLGASTYVWSSVSGLSSSTGSTISATPPLGISSYTVTGTDVNGCSNNAVVEITMHNPQLLISPNVSICSGELATLTCSGFDTYTWIPSTGLNITSGNNVQSNLAQGAITYSVTGTFTLVAGCTSSAAVSVTQNSPIASITPNKTAICSGDSAILTGSGIADAYLWSTGETATTISVAPMTTRNYTLTLSKGNCSDTDLLTINVTTQPTATITGESTICSGTRGVLSATSLVPGVTYLWNNESTTQGINVSPLTSTTYSVVISNASDGGTCKDTAKHFISVTTTPTITLTASKTIVCAGENLIISASGGGAGNYLWSTGASSNTINTTALSSQHFALTLNNFNCIDKDSISITVIPMPTASISGSSTICSGSSSSLTATGGDVYLWNTGETTASITKTPLSNINYSVSVSNGSASGGGLCIDTASRSITLINPIPTDVGPDITMAIGLDTVLSTNNGTAWNWSPLGRLNCYTCQSTVASPLQTTNYIVTVTDINGCIANDSITIFIIPCATLFIPKAFSPNNDGQNDVLYIRGTDCIDKVFSFTIFNRWGEKVFETTDIKAGWDGSQTMQTLPNEVFIYYLDALSINGDAISKTGNITLMK